MSRRGERELSGEREGLKRIGQMSGVLANSDGDKKLEWMYKSGDHINREEYLLGRAVDKNFERADAEEKEKLVGVQVHRNHVEHECIPFSIRSYHGLPTNDEQVDLQRKIMEDPLMAIRQREMETRKKLLENPVKLKEIHRLLRNDSDLDKKTLRKKEKKSSKKKKKKEKKSKNDLDEILAKKYREIRNETKDEGLGGMDIDRFLAMKYTQLSNELDKMSGKKSKSKDHSDKTRKRSRKRSRSRSNSRKDRRRDMGYKTETSYKRRSRSRSRSRSNHRSDPKSRRRSRSPSNSRHSKRYKGSPHKSYVTGLERRSRSLSPQKNQPRPSRLRHNERKTTKNRSSSSSSSSSRSSTKSRKTHDEEQTKIHYGLVSADGKPFESKEHYHRTDTKDMDNLTKKKVVQVKSVKPQQRTRLTEEEKAQKLIEMQENARLREIECQEKSERNRKEKIKEENQLNQTFDKDYVNKQMRKAFTNQVSVESRIRSNINNIQRSGRTMESNFARR